MHWHPGDRANANRSTTHRHRDARTHTAAYRYTDPGSTHSHEHAAADGDVHSRATHCYTFSQAQLYTTPQADSYLGACAAHRRSAG